MKEDDRSDQSLEFDETLIDPEPFSIFLAITGFLGSVASIVGYIEAKKLQNKQLQESRAKNLRESKDLLMTLEVDTMQMEASLRKLEFILQSGTNEYQFLPLSNARFEFGSLKPIFTLYGYREYEEILLELNRLVGRSFETTSKLLQKMYNLDFRFNGEIYHRLLELQNRLNAVLREGMSYENGFRIYYEIIAFTKDILRDMRIQVMNSL